MTEKVSKALKEVWEWKESVYEDIKDLSPHERIEFFRKQSDKFLDELGLERVRVGKDAYSIWKKGKTPVVAETDVKYEGGG